MPEILNFERQPLIFFARSGVVLLLLLVCSCSTPPKNPGNVDTLRKQAESQLQLANSYADRGGLETAMTLLDEAMRLAVMTDDSGLRIRTGISRGNALFSLGRREEAAVDWNKALDEAGRQGNEELAAVCRTYIARGKLLGPGGKDAAQSVRNELSRDIAYIKSDKLYAAFAWTVIGLAEKELGNYAGAESAVRRSLEIHEKNRYFELAAYNWFLIASFRSLGGNYTGARQALESAIALDRRIENSWGLASDWRALGDVEKKAGNRDAARAAYQRAAEIFSAVGNEEAAAEALSRSGE
jgi:tetratricopeptide (TPR) repeat protein